MADRVEIEIASTGDKEVARNIQDIGVTATGSQSAIDQLNTSLAAAGDSVSQLSSHLNDSISVLGTAQSGSQAASNSIRQVADTSAQASAQVQNLQQKVTGLHQSFLNAIPGASLLQTAIGGIAAALAVDRVLQASETYDKWRGRLQALGLTADQAQGQISKLLEVSDNTRTDLGANISLYTSLTKSLSSYGVANEDVMAAVQNLGKIAVSSGQPLGNISEIFSSLSTRMAMGIPPARALASLFVEFPDIGKIISQRVGVGFHELTQQLQNGQISVAQFIGYINQAGGQIDAKFQRMPESVGQAFTKLNNHVQEFIGRSASASGAAGVMVSAIDFLANHVDAAVITLGLFTAGLVAVKTVQFVSALASATGAVLSFSAALLASPATWIALAAVLTAGAAVWLIYKNNVLGAGDAIDKATDSVGKLLGTGLDTAMSSINQSIQNAAGGLNKMGAGANQLRANMAPIPGSAADLAQRLAEANREIDAHNAKLREQTLKLYEECNRELEKTVEEEKKASDEAINWYTGLSNAKSEMLGIDGVTVETLGGMKSLSAEAGHLGANLADAVRQSDSLMGSVSDIANIMGSSSMGGGTHSFGVGEDLGELSKFFNQDASATPIMGGNYENGMRIENHLSFKEGYSMNDVDKALSKMDPGDAAHYRDLLKHYSSDLTGFATGGSFTVGMGVTPGVDVPGLMQAGSGSGVDSRIVAFKATPGERVTIETPDQVNKRMEDLIKAAAGGGPQVSMPVTILANDLDSFKRSASQVQRVLGGALVTAAKRK